MKSSWLSNANVHSDRNRSELAGIGEDRSVGTEVYVPVHEDAEYRADNSASALADSGLRTFSATPMPVRAVDLCRYV